MEIDNKIDSVCETCNARSSKPAFSLAEGLVMLVVVSVLLAVSAPLIAKKNNADAQRAVRMQNEDVISAVGNNQQFTLGNVDNEADRDKLIVYGKTALNGNVGIGDKFVITEDADKHKVTIGLDGGATPITIDTQTGETNIPTGVPDFSKHIGVIGTFTLTEDAFLYESNSAAGGVTITSGTADYEAIPFSTENKPAPTITPVTSTVKTTGGNEVTVITALPRLTQVKKGDTIECPSNLSVGNFCTLYPMAKYNVGTPKK